VLIAYSTSGNSQNIHLAMLKARALNVKTVCFTGQDGGVCSDAGDYVIKVPSVQTARIQEMHTFIGHCICAAVEKRMAFEF